MAQKRTSHLNRRCLFSRTSELKITLAACAVVLALSACAYSASEQFLAKASDHGFSELTLPTKLFELQAYQNNAATYNKTDVLHVYLAGDGLPFFRGRYVNPDPTPRNALALKLMALDPSPSVLIGRPCYHQQASSALCQDSKWWTTHRYSDEVVDAIAQAINDYATNASKIVLVGFSGGGTLAVLVAQKVENIDTIVGINPNLNTKAWARQHGYTPLLGSLNPADSTSRIPQYTRILLLTGTSDKNVSAHLWQKHYQGLTNVKIVSYSNFTHTCCWTEVWPEILNSLSD